VLPARWCPPWERQAPAWHGTCWLTKSLRCARRSRQSAGHAWRPATGGRCRAGAQCSQGEATGHGHAWRLATGVDVWCAQYRCSRFLSALSRECPLAKPLADLWPREHWDQGSVPICTFAYRAFQTVCSLCISSMAERNHLRRRLAVRSMAWFDFLVSEREGLCDLQQWLIQQ